MRCEVQTSQCRHHALGQAAGADSNGSETPARRGRDLLGGPGPTCFQARWSRTSLSRVARSLGSNSATRSGEASASRSVLPCWAAISASLFPVLRPNVGSGACCGCSASTKQSAHWRRPRSRAQRSHQRIVYLANGRGSHPGSCCCTVPGNESNRELAQSCARGVTVFQLSRRMGQRGDVLSPHVIEDGRSDSVAARQCRQLRTTRARSCWSGIRWAGSRVQGGARAGDQCLRASPGGWADRRPVEPVAEAAAGLPHADQLDMLRIDGKASSRHQSNRETLLKMLAPEGRQARADCLLAPRTPTRRPPRRWPSLPPQGDKGREGFRANFPAISLLGCGASFATVIDWAKAAEVRIIRLRRIPAPQNAGAYCNGGLMRFAILQFVPHAPAQPLADASCHYRDMSRGQCTALRNLARGADR